MYNSALRFGTSKDKIYWYICPKYWDFARSLVLTEEEAKSGKYGKIIKKTKGYLEEDENIVDNTQKGKINEYPGFSTFPNKSDEWFTINKCLPCCFNKKQHESNSTLRLKNICLKKWRMN